MNRLIFKNPESQQSEDPQIPKNDTLGQVRSQKEDCKSNAREARDGCFPNESLTLTANKLFQEDLAPMFQSEFGINLDGEFLLAQYEKSEKNIDLNAVKNHFDQLSTFAGQNPETSKKILQLNEDKLKNVLLRFINGDLQGGEDLLGEITDEITIAYDLSSVLPDLQKERRGITRLERSHTAQLRKTLDLLTAKKPDKLAIALQDIQLSKAYLKLIVGIKPLGEFQEKFIDNNKEKSEACNKVLSYYQDDYFNYSTILLLPKKPDGYRSLKQTKPIPKNSEEYGNLLANAENQIIHKKANYYKVSKDPEYQKDFLASQQIMTEALYVEAQNHLDVDRDNELAHKDATKLSDAIIFKFDVVQKAQLGGTLPSLKSLNSFSKDVGILTKALKGGRMPKGLSVYFEQLNINIPGLKHSSPEIAARLADICAVYQKQADNLARDVVSRDETLAKAREDYGEFHSGAMGIIKTYQGMVEQLKKGEDMPSERMMESIQGDLRNFMINGPYLNKFDPLAYRHFMAIKRESAHLPCIAKIEDDFKQVEEFNKAFDEVVDFIFSNKGSRSGELGMLKNAASLGAAVGAAVVAGMLFVPSGGTSAAILGFVIANTAGTLGYATAEYAFGNKKAMEPKNLAVSWGYGLAFGGAGALLARPFGTALGHFVRGANKKLAGSKIPALSAFGKRELERKGSKLLSGKPADTFGKKGLLRRFFTEFGEESFEEGMQGLAAAVAKDNEFLSIAFAMLPMSRHHAKMVSETGSYPINGDIICTLDRHGMVLKYTDKSAMLAFLKSQNIPAHHIRRFRKKGVLKIKTPEGRIAIKKTAEAPGINRILCSLEGAKAKRRAKLKFDKKTRRYTYEGDPKALVQALKAEYFVEIDADGNLILTGIDGNKIKIEHLSKTEVETTINAKLLSKIKDLELRKKAQDLVDVLWPSGRKLTKEGFNNAIHLFSKIGYELSQASKELLLAVHKRFQEQAQVLHSSALMGLDIPFRAFGLGVADFVKGRKLKTKYKKLEWQNPIMAERISKTKFNDVTGEKLTTADKLELVEVHLEIMGLVADVYHLDPTNKDVLVTESFLDHNWCDLSQLEAFADKLGDAVDVYHGKKPATTKPNEVAHKPPHSQPPEVNQGELMLREYLQNPNQPQLTREIVSSGLFQIEKTIDVAGYKFHMGPIFENNGQLFSFMMVDKGSGILMPRLVYKSSSGGGWKSTPGESPGGNISKGDFLKAYTTEGDLVGPIAKYLGQKDKDKGRILRYGSQPYTEFFGYGSELRAQVDTYSEEVGRDPHPLSYDFGVFHKENLAPGKYRSLSATKDIGLMNDNFAGMPGLMPSFGSVISTRKAEHTLFGECTYESFRSNYKGYQLEWEFGQDHLGRVWIQSIDVLPRRVTSYGNHADVLITGILTSKPIEYTEQATGLNLSGRHNNYSTRGPEEGVILEDAIHPYVDITPLLDNMLPIQEYRRARNVYRKN
jgi:hypothetical protein